MGISNSEAAVFDNQGDQRIARSQIFGYGTQAILQIDAEIALKEAFPAGI